MMRPQTPLILTIIIPVYNAENTIKTCLLSLTKQSIEDIEIICINDCSTDSSVAMINQSQQSDSRIKLLKLSQKGGAGGARNLGIQQAKGKYILFVDADDTLEPNSLAGLIMKAEDEQADIVVFDNNFVRNNEKKPRHYPFIIRDFKNPIDHVNFALTNDPEAWRRLFSTKLLQENALNFAENIYYEDVEFVVKTAFHAKKMCIYPHHIYNYYIHNQSVSYKFDDKALLSKLVIMHRLHDFLIEKNIYSAVLENYKARIWAMYRYHCENITKSNLAEAEKQKILKKYNALFLSAIIYSSDFNINHEQLMQQLNPSKKKIS